MDNEDAIRKQISETLKQTFRNGLLQGTTAICAVILEKAKQEDKTAEERINDIKTFCETGLGAKKKQEED